MAQNDIEKWKDYVKEQDKIFFLWTYLGVVILCCIVMMIAYSNNRF